MTPENQRTLITVAGTLIAALIAAIAGVGGTLLREAYLQRKTLQVRAYEARLSALKDVLTGLYQVNLALSARLKSSIFADALQLSVSPEGVRQQAAAAASARGGPLTEAQIVQRFLQGVDRAREDQVRHSEEMFDFHKEFLRLSGSILCAAAIYGNYPAEFGLPDRDLPSDVQGILSLVSSGEAKDYATAEAMNRHEILFAAAADIQTLIRWEVANADPNLRQRKEGQKEAFKLKALPEINALQGHFT